MRVLLRNRETGMNDGDPIENVEMIDLREKKGRRVFLIAGGGQSRFVALKDYELSVLEETPAAPEKPAAKKKPAAAAK